MDPYTMHGPYPPLLLSRWLGFVSVDLYTYSPIFLPIGLSYLSIYLSIYIYTYICSYSYVIV